MKMSPGHSVALGTQSLGTQLLGTQSLGTQSLGYSVVWHSVAAPKMFYKLKTFCAGTDLV
jgi:hypothetical protein